MDIPRDLAPVLPRYFDELANRRVVFSLGVIGYAVLVYGCVRYPNGWIRILPALLGPILAAIFLSIRSWNPYKSMYVSSSDPIIRDPRAQKLVQLLRSGRARQAVWRTAIAHSLGLFSVSSMIAMLSSRPRSWEFAFSEILAVSFVVGILSLGWIYHFLVYWVIREWKLQQQPGAAS